MAEGKEEIDAPLEIYRTASLAQLCEAVGGSFVIDRLHRRQILYFSIPRPLFFHKKI